MTVSLVHQFLEASAARLPGKVALVAEGRRMTYAQLESLANRLANGLRAHGLRRGERVVLHLPNSLELAAAIFAVLKAGGVFVALHPTTKLDKLAAILRDCQASVLLTRNLSSFAAQTLAAADPALKLGIVTAEAEAAPFPVVGYDELAAGHTDERRPAGTIDLDLACLVYTSGSTGVPKGVMSDHSNVVFAARSIMSYLHNQESDVVVNLAPLSFDYGLYQLLMVVAFGGTLLLERSFAYPAAVLERVAAEGVTGFPGVPTIFSVLLSLDLSGYDLSRLRYFTNTAAALPTAHVRQLRERFPHVALYSMYGLTETKRTLYLPPAEVDLRPGSVGIPIPGTEVWLEDEQGRRLGPNEVGQLVVRGRHVMRGYWGDPEATARRFRPGPLAGERVCYTGDLFRADPDGRYYFVARMDDILKVGGEKVAPREIENVLYQLAGVREAAVIGVPDERLGQAIKAFVVADRPELTEADVMRHCRAHLEDYLLPRQVVLCAALPKSESGKLQVHSLR